MRNLPKYGTTIGAVGLLLLAVQNSSNLLAEVKRKPCVDCGAPMGAHAIEGDRVTCPGVGNAK